MAKLRYSEMKDRFDADGLRRGQERELAEATKESQERFERQLEKEIAEEDEKQARAGRVDPPPELSPAEAKERERVEREEERQRLARVEAGVEKVEQERRFRDNPKAFYGSVESSEQHRRREGLRLLRIQKANEAQDERNRAHEKRVARVTEKLEAELSTVDSELAAEDQRHAEATEDLKSKRLAIKDKMEALLARLPEGESSEQRLESVMV